MPVAVDIRDAEVGGDDAGRRGRRRAESPPAVADLDEDGRPDVLSMGFGNAVNVLPGRALPFAWKGLGHGLAGSLGIPSFAGTGTLAAGEPVKLVLAGARPSAPAWLVIGSQQLGLPFKGGTLVPYPAIVLAGAVGSAGTLSLQGPMPPGTPPGFTRLFQWWVADPAGPANAAASNALSATTAP